MAEQKEKEKKAAVRRPKALKRDLQNEKRRLLNKSFRSKMATAINSFKKDLSTKDKKQVAEELSCVFSLMDKGVKKNIFKPNKANRTKSRLSKKVVR